MKKDLYGVDFVGQVVALNHRFSSENLPGAGSSTIVWVLPDEFQDTYKTLAKWCSPIAEKPCPTCKGTKEIPMFISVASCPDCS